MSIFGPAWFKRSGDGIGNEPTCNHLFNARTTLIHSLHKSVWDTNPAYVPLVTYLDYSQGGETGSVLSNVNTSNTGFVRWLSPARFHRATMAIITNQSAVKDVGFRVYLARGGPTTNKAASGIRLERLLFSVPPISDPEYTTHFFKEAVNLTMYSGQAYGYYFLINDPVPSLPAGSFPSVTTSMIMTADVEFGAGGIE